MTAAVWGSICRKITSARPADTRQPRNRAQPIDRRVQQIRIPDTLVGSQVGGERDKRRQAPHDVEWTGQARSSVRTWRT
jgi:hypothetical protein